MYFALSWRICLVVLLVPEFAHPPSHVAGHQQSTPLREDMLPASCRSQTNPLYQCRSLPRPYIHPLPLRHASASSVSPLRRK